jgi:DNA-directed RNA polymerase specialized sigma24 family protein
MEPEPGPGGVLRVDALSTYSVADGAAVAAVRMFDDFYRAERDSIARALAVTLGDPGLAAEAVDEAMARAYQRWERVGVYDSPGGWVYRVALNWATSVLRRHRRPVRAVHERGPTDVGPVPEPAVAAALAELDVRQRAVVVCRFYLGMSEAETAAALGIRPGTAKSRLHRAIQHLQVRLDHLRPEEKR